MSVSSITAPAPVAVPQPTTAHAPPAQTDASSNDASTAQPTPPAPLPPGQGTRIDQLA
jgi:hypothetical protein